MLFIKTIKKKRKTAAEGKKNPNALFFFFLKTFRARKLACACVHVCVCVVTRALFLRRDVGHGRGSTGADRCAPSLHWKEECS